MRQSNSETPVEQTEGPSTEIARSRVIRWLVVFVGILLFAQWLTWLPHYLTWPWWPDLDAYATIALGWITGKQKPYRDVVIFNFPGQIEIFAIIGWLGGVGRTQYFYAFDALLLLHFDLLAFAWSRRRFRSALPGMLAALTVGYYVFGQDYSLAAQRDSQGPLLAMMAVFCLDGAAGGWPRRIAAAMLYGLALVIRPHAILFLPAVLLAIRPRPGERYVGRTRILWLGWLGVLTLLWLAPLADVWPEMIRGVRQAAYGSTYNQRTSGNFAVAWLDQFDFRDPPRSVAPSVETVRRIADARLIMLAIILAGIAITRFRGWFTSAPKGRDGWAIPLYFLIALFYEPLHPKWHAYLAHPRHLASGILLGYLAGMWIERGSRVRPKREAWCSGWVLLILLGSPAWPAFCRPDRVWEACVTLAQGDLWPQRVPAGAEEMFPPLRRDAAYSWFEYRSLLMYLKSSSRADVPVANLVRNLPLPAINGPIGRRSPWPAESGIIWLYSVNAKLEPDFVQALQAAPSGTILVWDPDLPARIPGLEVETLRAAARRLTQFDRRFGAIEVRRKP